jgi:molybdopterin synthase catalytic subunit
MEQVSAMIRVQREDFVIGDEIAALRAGRDDFGAIVTFTGTVRNNADDTQLIAMELEHYPGMTENELQAIEQEACNRWPIQASSVIHRYGRLAPGENIVLVITASAHRLAAFEAAEFIMDFLKTRATFWKREIGPDNIGKWVSTRDSDDAALKRWVSSQ